MKDHQVKEVLRQAGRSWCGVPGCQRCRQEYRKLRRAKKGGTRDT